MKILLSLLLAIALVCTASAEPAFIDVQGLQVPSNATYLDLGKTQIKNYKRFMESLTFLPALTRVDLYASKPTEKQVWGLVNAFQEISFGMTMPIAGFRCRTDDLIFSMHRRGKPLYKSKAFKQLTLCPEMKALDLGHNLITDLSFLMSNSRLRYLILADNKITDLSPLARLANLQYLEIFMNEVTDLSPLANLTELKDINLCYNKATDLSPLYGLKNLERIWLSHNGLTTEAVAELQRQLPEAEINDSVLLSTQGGWREHPRFFAMRHTFDKGVFIPFEVSLP